MYNPKVENGNRLNEEFFSMCKSNIRFFNPKHFKQGKQIKSIHFFEGNLKDIRIKNQEEIALIFTYDCGELDSGVGIACYCEQPEIESAMVDANNIFQDWDCGIVSNYSIFPNMDSDERSVLEAYDAGLMNFNNENLSLDSRLKMYIKYLEIKILNTRYSLFQSRLREYLVKYFSETNKNNLDQQIKLLELLFVKLNASDLAQSTCVTCNYGRLICLESYDQFKQSLFNILNTDCEVGIPLEIEQEDIEGIRREFKSCVAKLQVNIKNNNLDSIFKQLIEKLKSVEISNVYRPILEMFMGSIDTNSDLYRRLDEMLKASDCMILTGTLIQNPDGILIIGDELQPRMRSYLE